MKVQRWENFESNLPIPFRLIGPLGSIGYLPLYATREDAEQEFPEGPFIEVQAVA